MSKVYVRLISLTLLELIYIHKQIKQAKAKQKKLFFNLLYSLLLLDDDVLFMTFVMLFLMMITGVGDDNKRLDNDMKTGLNAINDDYKEQQDITTERKELQRQTAGLRYNREIVVENEIYINEDFISLYIKHDFHYKKNST